MTPEEQEVVDWINSWDVDPIVTEEDATLIDMKVTISPSPWIDSDDEDSETVLEVVLAVGAPSYLWENLSDVQKESSKQTSRLKVWEEVVLPLWEGADA